MIPKFCVCKICGYASTCVVKLQNYTLPCDFVIFVKIAYFGIFAFFVKNTKKHDFSSVQISQQTPVCFSPNYVLFSTPPPPVNGGTPGGQNTPKCWPAKTVQFCHVRNFRTCGLWCLNFIIMMCRELIDIMNDVANYFMVVSVRPIVIALWRTK